MEVWKALGLEPTDDLLAIRNAYYARASDSSPDAANREQLQVACDTAALWCAAGFPPSELHEAHLEALKTSFGFLERAEVGAAARFEPATATVVARRFFDPATFPAERREGILALRPGGICQRSPRVPLPVVAQRNGTPVCGGRTA